MTSLMLRQKLKDNLDRKLGWFVRMSYILLAIAVIWGGLYFRCVGASFWPAAGEFVVTLFVMMFLLWSSFLLSLALLMMLPPPFPFQGIISRLIRVGGISICPQPYPVPFTPPRLPRMTRGFLIPHRAK